MWAPGLAPTAELQATMQRLWALPWENGRKDAFWRLVYDALPTAARLHRDRPCLCGGSAARPDRQHHFWDCTVARAVVADIEAACGAAAAPAPAPLTRANLWLARPAPGLHAGVWGVVSLAAVEAMDRGRRSLTAAHLRGQDAALSPSPSQPRYSQLSLHAFLRPADADGPQPPPPPPPASQWVDAPPADPVVAAVRVARLAFWSLLADFEALDCAPAAWLSSVPPSHPLLSPQGGRLCVRPIPLSGGAV